MRRSWGFSFPSSQVSIYFFEIPIHVVGIAITTGFAAALADGSSIGAITPTQYKGYILFPIIPIVLQIMQKLAFMETRRIMQRIWNIMTATALGAWWILFFLKLGIESSIPKNVSFVSATIPLWVFFGFLFIGSLSNMMITSRKKYDEAHYEEDEDDEDEYDAESSKGYRR
jgi:hypothetical protein